VKNGSDNEEFVYTTRGQVQSNDSEPVEWIPVNAGWCTIRLFSTVKKEISFSVSLNATKGRADDVCLLTYLCPLKSLLTSARG
jgi:hypothetical protein